MPIYEFVCNDCDARYERIVMSQKQTIACPKCSSERRTLQLSVFSAGKPSDGGSSSAPSSSGGCGCNPHSCGCH